MSGRGSQYYLEGLVVPERGLPNDTCELIKDYVFRYQKYKKGHSGFSWVIVSEILNACWEKKIVIQNAKPVVTYAELIGEEYLRDILDRLISYGKPEKVRMVFWYY